MRRHSQRHRLIVSLVLGLLPLLAGCSIGQGPPASSALSIQTAKHRRANGTPIALEPVRLSKSALVHVPTGVRIYSLTYWSRGLRCQAYLDVPSGGRAYPLWVLLHGGDIWGEPGHYNGFPVMSPSFAAGTAEPDAITFLPNYGGYGPSQGDVGDGYNDYVDVMNGFRALKEITGLHVRRKDTILSGASLGGIVALLTAAHDPEVRGVVLISPWPGAEEMASWLESHPTAKLTTDDQLYAISLSETCSTGLQSGWCRQNSVPYQDIKVPVLIVGGAQDPKNPPGMLQAMAKDLRRFNKHVELRIVPGGHAPMTAAAGAIEHAWYLAHGWNMP